MTLLGTIRESDVYPDTVDAPDESYGNPREVVRVMLKDTEGKYGFIEYQSIHPGYLGVLGGGVDVGEAYEQALRREVREEAGCEMENIRELGVIHEYGVRHLLGARPKYAERTLCFVADVLGPKGVPSYDAVEEKGRSRTVWLSLREAEKKFSAQEQGFSKHRAKILIDATRKA